VLLIVMVALTLVLLPRLNDERRPRRDAPHPEETPPRDE
jgi:hypothetical protein